MFIIIAIVFVITVLNENIDRSARLNKLRKQGFFDKSDYRFYLKQIDEFSGKPPDLWRKNVPKELIPFLEQNPSALRVYSECWAAEREANAGYKPYFHPFYDKRNFDPYGKFYYQFGEKIEEFNRRTKGDPKR